MGKLSVDLLPRTKLDDTEKGTFLIVLLGLKVKRNGRVDTSWGDKTPAGLYLTIKRFMEQELKD